MLRGSVTASLIGYLSLMLVKEFGQLLIEISSLLEGAGEGKEGVSSIGTYSLYIIMYKIIKFQVPSYSGSLV